MNDHLLNNIHSIKLNNDTSLNKSKNKIENDSLRLNNFISESLINFSLNQNEFPPLSNTTSNKEQLNYNSIFNDFSSELNKSTINRNSLLSGKSLINQDCLLSDTKSLINQDCLLSKSAKSIINQDYLSDTKSIINQNQILNDINLIKDKRSSIFNSNHNLLKEQSLLNQLPNTRSINSIEITDYQNLILDLKWITRDNMIFYLNRFTSILSGKTLNDDLKNKLIKDNQQMINTLTNLKLRSKINQYNKSIDQFNSANGNNEIYLNFEYGLRTSLINQLIKNQDLITMNSELFTNEIKKLVIFENNLLIQKLLGLSIGYIVNDSEIDDQNCLEDNLDNLDDIRKDINQLYDLYENHVINKEEIDTYAKKFGDKIINLESKLQDLDLLKKEIIEIKFNLNLSTANHNVNNFGNVNFFRQQNVNQGFNLENFDLNKFDICNFDLNKNLNEPKIIDQFNFDRLNMNHQNLNSSNNEHQILNSNMDQLNLNESNLNITNKQNLNDLLIRDNIDFRFDLDNINEFLDSNFISQCSQPFEIGNYSFQLGFIISKFKDNGRLIKGMEIYLICENDPNDDWYCKVINCEFIIISSVNGKDKSIKLSNLEFNYKKSFHQICDKFNKFISIEELKRSENGFINDDYLSVGINLDV